MKSLILSALIVFSSLNSFALTITRGGVQYTCTPDSTNSCETKCVKYCSSYDRWPFADRCLSNSTSCEPGADVQTICAEYDSYPFQDRCLQQEDIVLADRDCN